MSATPDPDAGAPAPRPPEADDPSEVTVQLSRSKLGNLRRRTIPTLRVVAGRDMLRYVTLSAEKQIVIGRDEGADLRLADVTVSKRHARVLCDGNGTVTAIDLQSTNGSGVNGRPISRAVLRPGDHLEIGAVCLRLDMLSLDELAHLGRVVQRIEAANRDPLTGLLTRGYLDEELPQLAERCGRADVPFSCAFIDVDHFKSINDTFGHQIGDEVLSGVSRLIMLGVRDNDPCVRYGGEEIVVLLPGSNEDGAGEVAERIRKAIATHDWDRTAGSLRVTASFGVAQRRPKELLHDWVQRADQAVYDAKRCGRNRVQRSSLMNP